MRPLRLPTLLLLAFTGLLLTTALARPAEPESRFRLQDGDTWVMAGDSITAQHLHSNYLEAFCFARYPKLTFRFRNSGVGGDTITKVLARFDWDVAAWKPTVVSVELGMNDKGGSTTEQYIANMKQLADKIRSVKARPVFFTASPVNNGDTMAKLGGNTRLHEYAVALKTFATEEKAPFADQFHELIDLWGKNKPNENRANAVDAVRALAKDDKLAGVEHLRAFLAEQDKGGPLVSMKGDAVHPGIPGQIMMATALLKDLGANGFVSSVTLDARGKVTEAKGCVVEELKGEEGQLVFERLDESLPFPIPDEARTVLPLYPGILDLSRYTLKATGLEGNYQVQVNGVTLATVSGKELAAGVNLTAYGKGPIAEQGKEVLEAVKAKEGLVGQWRQLSKTASAAEAPADAKEKLAAMTKKVEEADGKIREAAKPKKLRFTLTPAK
jgi:lysophospholipase L1-like esterase